MPPHPFTSIFDGLSDSRIRWIVPVLGAKVNPGLGCSMVFKKISSPAGSIFSLKTLALPTPYLFEAPETKTTEATERRIKKNVG